MKILAELRQRFRLALADLVDDPSDVLQMVRPAQDPRFGDYQANCAMPLGKRLARPPRQVAAEIVARLDLEPLCTAAEIAGPGFINLRLNDEWIVQRLGLAVHDQRLGVPTVAQPRTFVIDYSSPNVAKPMHVGHIRSTVIGDALCRTLRFLGHRAISDNHLGDWGTQFGMIIYGYKHFVNRDDFGANPVAELSRLYKLVNQLVEYHNGVRQLPELQRRVYAGRAEIDKLALAPPTGDKSQDKKQGKLLRRLRAQVDDLDRDAVQLRNRLQAVDTDPFVSKAAGQHPNIGESVLLETAKLHAGDDENLRLWKEFLPQCRNEIQRIYDRIQIQFDFEYGESYYQDRLAAVVQEFEERELAQVSAGAICVFLDGFETPMIIRKKDGAFLYATTDLATIQMRMQEWHPDVILYIVDHRQAEHFDKLFAAARLWGYDNVELKHVSFGTVMGEDRRPYKTRSGDTVGLEGLLDEAIDRAYAVVSESDDGKKHGPELTLDERRHIAQVIGHAAIKYADLSHSRTSDYVFSYDKMLAMTGNTATYLQYSYARVNGIFAKGGIDIEQLRQSGRIHLGEPHERALGLELLRFADALEEMLEDYRPHLLSDYLFGLTKVFFTFYEHCEVLDAGSDELRDCRLLLCDLTARTIKQGLELLGIDVVNRM